MQAIDEIFQIHGTDYKGMTLTLLERADLARLIGDKGKRIGIKPNLVTSTPADLGATTHPEVVEAIIGYLQERGFHNLLVLEGSWVGDKTADAVQITGFEQLTKKYGVEFFDTQKDTSYEVDCGDGIVLNVCSIVKDIDFMINVPVLKGHCQTRMTCACKNLKGLIPNSEKRRFHAMGLHEPIAYLQKAIRQDFVVVDHICGDLDFEEGGNPITRNCVMTAIDPVLVDSLACRIIGIEPHEVRYLTIAEALGIGSTKLADENIIHIGERVEYADENTRKSLLEVSIAAEEVDACSACYASLTEALLRLKADGLLDKLKDRIAIGQGFDGKTGKLGVGKCTRNFAYNIPGCPPDGDRIYESLKACILK